MASDFLQSFLFDHTDIRGAIVKLDQSLAELLNNHGYNQGQRTLLGQFVAANLLMTSHIKFDGLLSLQARGEQNVSLLMSECSNNLDFRGIIRGDGQIEDDSFAQIFAGGVFAITIEPRNGARYQGIVSLDNANLGECLADYFARSEQLPSWFYFAEYQNQVTGLILQALPASRCHDPQQRQEDWQRIVHLASTLTPVEACTLDSETLLHRLYHEEPLRLFAARPVRFHCNCSRERMERALLTLGNEELMTLIDEDDQIETQCHFCNHSYVFQRAEMLHLLQGGHLH